MKWIIMKWWKKIIMKMIIIWNNKWNDNNEII